MQNRARSLLAVLLSVGGLLAVALGLRAIAQQPSAGGESPPAATAPAAEPSSTPSSAQVPAPVTAPAAAPAAQEPELQQSADNNISFPVDI